MQAIVYAACQMTDCVQIQNATLIFFFVYRHEETHLYNTLR